MWRCTVAILGSLVFCGLLGCNGLPDLPAMIEGDWEPAILEQVEPVGPRAIALTFSEEVELIRSRFDPEIGDVVDTSWDGEALVLRVSQSFDPGAEYAIDAEVRDRAGNISAFVARFYGLNPRLPPVLINEIVCEGSGSRPDFVELRVLEPGNLGGLSISEGGPRTWDSRFVFPQIEVAADDYVIVHWKPSGDGDEITEIDDRGESGGTNAHPDAWDVWVAGGDGIPNSTGGLTLSAWPGGPLLDAFLYTTKRYEADSDKRGFGLSSQLDIFEEIVAAGGWVISGDFVIPDDGFDPEDSTATRSINRRSTGEDSNHPSDWHIVPTSGATPGSVNSDEVYVP